MKINLKIINFRNKFYKPPILIWIEKMFQHACEKEWYETYHFFDIHGVISKPDYRKGYKKSDNDCTIINYYPYAKETLQLLSKRDDIILIMFTSSYPEEIEIYNKIFKKDNIIFKYINENPEISNSNGCFGYYEKKPYYNCLYDDKSGFDPDHDWAPIYNYFKKTKYRPNPNWTKKYKESYHKN